jgi:nitrate reductase (cytochrome), electron transfer subunit
MVKFLISFLIIISLTACGDNDKDQAIDEDRLGFIESDVESEETSFKMKAKYSENMPGQAQKLDRAFENAPPMIPHTTSGFFPITIKNNICLSCHMPDKAEEVNSVPIPETHFTIQRPDLVKIGDKFSMADDSKITKDKKQELNNAYFNCSQCHAPQAEVSVDIKNLFTPEFREKLGTEKSDLFNKMDEGIK